MILFHTLGIIATANEFSIKARGSGIESLVATG
jgi:hypothetical protein